uniref:major histocompatibility complex class I-related gene protein-like isoform X2 n=1 Tax=Scatophagus argus TaxID=75038 RepID=UPI001ED8439B|nr:major histocompatibility complex class I-related gene protein-like isoform X2 [Scatophagus argus]
MKTLVFVALLGTGLHVAVAVKHSLKYFYTVSSGLPNIPEFVAVGSVDDVLLGSCDSDKKTPEAKQDCVEKQLQSDLQQFELYNQQCLKILPNFFKATIHTLTQRFNQSGGVHVLQVMSGCEWDDETGEINGFDQFAHDGEDLISFDLKTLTWVALKPQAVIIKLSWDADKARIKNIEIRLTQMCPQWLKTYLAYGNSSLLRTDLPSVSLLQKTPSSPVSCHATGFYPERATLSWRKDGEELHEDVELGEILPNHDGTFQMSAELKLSSVTPEDWSRYTCVFQLSGVKEEIVTKLDKADIRTNEVKLTDTTLSISIIIIIIVSVVVLLLVLIAAIGVVAYKMRNTQWSQPNKKTPVDTSARERLTRTSESETSSTGSSISSVGSDTPLVTAS